MKGVLWLLGLLLAAVAAFLGWLFLFKPEQYMPESYEDMYALGAVGVLLEILMLIAFGVILGEVLKTDAQSNHEF